MVLWMLACASLPPDADGDHFLSVDDGGHDCDDDDPAIFPEAIEIVCDGIDQDCDGDPGPGFRDADGDGRGAAVCADGEGPAGFVALDGDCDDTNPAIRPGLPEICDGLDNDCDGVIDVGARRDSAAYPDGDGDGFGDPAGETRMCEGTADYVILGGDCDDHDPTRSPAQPERCSDGVDQDCDGEDIACPPFRLADAEYYLKANLGPSICSGDLDDNGDTELMFGTGYHETPDGGWWLFDTGVEGPAYWFTGRAGLGGACGVADLDHDGVDDLLLPANDAAFVVYGEAGVLESGTLRDGLWDGAQELYGSTGSLVGAPVLRGDVDNDGMADLVVGAPYSDAHRARGAVYALVGLERADTTLGDGGIVILGDTSGGYAFGASIGLVDSDADGRNDLAVGDPVNSEDTAKIFLFEDPVRGEYSDKDADRVIRASSGLGFGEVVTSGDTTGDGYGSLVTTLSGAVVVMPGARIASLAAGVQPVASAVGTEIHGPEGLGFAMTIGDFDLDGFGDLAVTAVRDAALDGGRAYLFRGPVADGVLDTAAADWSAIGTEATGLGISVAIVPYPDSTGSLWLLGAATGEMQGFVTE